ncbi:MAG TPA: hypothetical protein VGC79_08570 [Polyangiaceae bacterium]
MCNGITLRAACTRLFLGMLLVLAGLARPALARAAIADAGPDAETPTDSDPPPAVTSLETTESVVHGSLITVKGDHLPLDPKKISLDLDGFDLGHPLRIASDRKSFSFILPQRAKRKGVDSPLPIGRQVLLRLTIALEATKYEGMATQPYEAGFLSIASDARPALKLTGIEPLVVTPATPHLVLMGEGLGGEATNYVLLRDGREIPLCWTDACQGLHARITSPYQLEVDGFYDAQGKLADEWREEHTLSLRLGDTVASGSPLKIRFITCTPSQVQTWSVLVSMALLGLILLIAFYGGGMQRIKSATGRSARYVRAFLLDPETDTYSLSKLQFYAWSTAALIGYCYLTLSRALAQGKLDIMDIPENLPGIIGISAGTTIASMGISSARGPKGAGPVHPSFSDLISTGGIVAPERFQFLLWTFVAIGTFLFTVSRADPAVISDLPAIPSRLLWISGVSSAGYLGGKVARAPGPIIDQIIATVGSLQLSIMGRNLSGDATVEIAGTSVAEFLDVAVHPDRRPKAVPSNDDDGSLSNTLELWLVSAPPEWVGKATLDVTVQNPDGQKATWPVTLDDAAQAQVLALAAVRAAAAVARNVPPTNVPPASPAPPSSSAPPRTS